MPGDSAPPGETGGPPCSLAPSGGQVLEASTPCRRPADQWTPEAQGGESEMRTEGSVFIKRWCKLLSQTWRRGAPEGVGQAYGSRSFMLTMQNVRSCDKRSCWSRNKYGSKH